MATIERLKKRPDFLAAAEGRRFHTERMTAQGRLREGDGEGLGLSPGLRLGFTVTKRVGGAPARNRIKRRLRAVAERVAADLPPEILALPADIVLIARRSVLEAPFEALGDDLRRAIPLVARPGSDRGPRRGTRPQAGPRRGRGAPAPLTTPDARGGVPDGQ